MSATRRVTWEEMEEAAMQAMDWWAPGGVAVPDAVLHGLEAADGIPPELSAKWDATMGKFGL